MIKREDHAAMIEPQTIKGAIERQIQQNNAQKTSHLSEASFFVADLSEVITKYNLWQKTLPGVTPFFGKRCDDEVSKSAKQP